MHFKYTNIYPPIRDDILQECDSSDTLEYESFTWLIDLIETVTSGSDLIYNKGCGRLILEIKFDFRWQPPWQYFPPIITHYKWLIPVHKLTPKTDRPTVRWAPSYLVLRNPVNIWSTETSVQYRKWNDKCPHRQGSTDKAKSARFKVEKVRESLTKELSMRKAQLFKCTEALDGLLIKGMSLKNF